MSAAEMRQIALQVFGVERYELANTRVRSRRVNTARATLCYLLRSSGWSYPRIGRFMGMDHAGAMHACRNIAQERSGVRRKLRRRLRASIERTLRMTEERDE